MTGRSGAGGTTGQSGSGGSAGAASPLDGTLEAHNAVRAAVMGEDIPPLTWSDMLAEYAQEWAETLAAECDSIRHRNPNMYGENIAARWSFGMSSPPYSGVEAVQAWADELECWTFGSIGRTEMCDRACVEAQSSSGCGHYTQLVWRNTQRVGCGYASCPAGNRKMEIIVCNYDPPGNYIGQEPY